MRPYFFFFDTACFDGWIGLVYVGYLPWIVKIKQPKFFFVFLFLFYLISSCHSFCKHLSSLPLSFSFSHTPTIPLSPKNSNIISISILCYSHFSFFPVYLSITLIQPTPPFTLNRNNSPLQCHAHQSRASWEDIPTPRPVIATAATTVTEVVHTGGRKCVVVVASVVIVVVSVIVVIVVAIVVTIGVIVSSIGKNYVNFVSVLMTVDYLWLHMCRLLLLLLLLSWWLSIYVCVCDRTSIYRYASVYKCVG